LSSSVEARVLSEIPSSPAPSEDSSAPSSPVTTTPTDDEDMSFNDNNELHEHDQTMEFENNDAMKLESPEVRMYKLILDNKLETVFPNIEVTLRIYLSLMISNRSGERSFSILRYIKNSYRSTMGQRRLNDLILLSAEQDISELKQVTFLTTRMSTGSKVDVFHQSQPLTQSSDVTHAVRVVKNVTCLSSLFFVSLT
jgi:hypothetical protein